MIGGSTQLIPRSRLSVQHDCSISESNERNLRIFAKGSREKYSQNIFIIICAKTFM